MSEQTTEPETSPADARLHAKVYGRVQGVGFRFFVLERAQRLGLTGTVRNLYFPKRLVEVIAEGPRPRLQQLLDALQTGPAMARVEHVDVLWAEARHEFSHFRIL